MDHKPAPAPDFLKVRNMMKSAIEIRNETKKKNLFEKEELIDESVKKLFNSLPSYITKAAITGQSKIYVYLNESCFGEISIRIAYYDGNANYLKYDEDEIIADRYTANKETYHRILNLFYKKLLKDESYKKNKYSIHKRYLFFGDIVISW
jgi:hypothetical protein